MKKGMGIFAAAVLALGFWAIKFSHHPIAWILGLTRSIPIYAAIAGALSGRQPN
jgi:hypothetical protein